MSNKLILLNSQNFNDAEVVKDCVSKAMCYLCDSSNTILVNNSLCVNLIDDATNTVTIDSDTTPEMIHDKSPDTILMMNVSKTSVTNYKEYAQIHMIYTVLQWLCDKNFQNEIDNSRCVNQSESIKLSNVKLNNKKISFRNQKYDKVKKNILQSNQVLKELDFDRIHNIFKSIDSNSYELPICNSIYQSTPLEYVKMTENTMTDKLSGPIESYYTFITLGYELTEQYDDTYYRNMPNIFKRDNDGTINPNVFKVSHRHLQTLLDFINHHRSFQEDNGVVSYDIHVSQLLKEIIHQSEEFRKNSHFVKYLGFNGFNPRTKQFYSEFDWEIYTRYVSDLFGRQLLDPTFLPDDAYNHYQQYYTSETNTPNMHLNRKRMLFISDVSTIKTEFFNRLRTEYENEYHILYYNQLHLLKHIDLENVSEILMSSIQHKRFQYDTLIDFLSRVRSEYPNIKLRYYLLDFTPITTVSAHLQNHNILTNRELHGCEYHRTYYHTIFDMVDSIEVPSLYASNILNEFYSTHSSKFNLCNMPNKCYISKYNKFIHVKRPIHKDTIHIGVVYRHTSDIDFKRNLLLMFLQKSMITYRGYDVRYHIIQSKDNLFEDIVNVEEIKKHELHVLLFLRDDSVVYDYDFIEALYTGLPIVFYKNGFYAEYWNTSINTDKEANSFDKTRFYKVPENIVQDMKTAHSAQKDIFVLQCYCLYQTLRKTLDHIILDHVLIRKPDVMDLVQAIKSAEQNDNQYIKPKNNIMNSAATKLTDKIDPFIYLDKRDDYKIIL